MSLHADRCRPKTVGLQDNVTFTKLVMATWIFAEQTDANVRLQAAIKLARFTPALVALSKIWSRNPTDWDMAVPTAAIGQIIQEGKISHIEPVHSTVEGGHWWAFKLLQEQLIAGVTQPAPDVLSFSIDEVYYFIVIVIELLKRVVGHLEASASQLRLCAVVAGAPRRFQQRFVELLTDYFAAIARLLRLREDASNSSSELEPFTKGYFDQLSEIRRRFDVLSRDYIGMDRESTIVLQMYAGLADAVVVATSYGHRQRPSALLQKLASLKLGNMPDASGSISPVVRQVRSVYEAFVGKMRQAACPLETLIEIHANYMPIPRFFFESSDPVQFKLHITPLPKPGHALVLRRKTMLALNFDGFLTFSKSE
eukprot:jgi/Hompol1/6843/HPOL_000476-RA